MARPGQLLKSVASLYREQFLSWFGITVPTSLVAAAVLLIADRQAKAISRGIPFGQAQFHRGDVFAVVGLRFGSFVASWLLGCIALGAIATVVSRLDETEVETAWRPDSHQRVRDRFGALVLAGLFIFCVFGAGVAAMEVVFSAVIRVVGWTRFSRFYIGAALVGSVLVASIVSWLGAAIPLVLRIKIGVWAALKRSVELSNGYEGALFLLVVQFLAGSYAAWFAVNYGLRFLLPEALRYTAWYGWMVYVVVILASAAVEPPIFIGLSLLADPDRMRAPALPPGSEQTTQV